MVVFDATMLVTLLHPETGCPIDSATGKPVEHAKERIEGLIRELQKVKTRIGIPTPALSEALVRIDGAKRVEFVEKLNDLAVFESLPFDQISAIEVATMTKEVIDTGDKRGGSTEIWNKIKYDRQIVAIAKARGAMAIYTDDGGLRNFAKAHGFSVIGLADVPIPPDMVQRELRLEMPPPPPEKSDEEKLQEIDDLVRDEISNTDPPNKDGGT